MPRALGDAVLVSVNSVGLAGSDGLILRTLSALPVQRLPSGPVTIPCGVMTSLTVNDWSAAGLLGGTFTIAFAAVSQRLPSGPLVMPFAPVTPVSGNSCLAPSGENRARVSPPTTTQTLPSDPSASL